MAPMVPSRLCWAACLAAAAAAASSVDTVGLLQTDVAVDRTALERAKPKKGKRQGGPTSPEDTEGNGASFARAGENASTASSYGADFAPVAPAPNASAANASEASASEANTSAGNSTQAKGSAGGANATRPADESNETGWCGYEAQHGFITTYTKPASDNLLLDLTDALGQGDGTVRFLVTAMSVSGTYVDGDGYLMEYASPMEETYDTMFEMRLAPDNISVDVFKPELDVRTSDRQTLAALRRGTGNGRFQNLGTFRCARRPAGSLIFKGSSSRATGAANLFQREGSLVDSLLEGRGAAQDITVVKDSKEQEVANASAPAVSLAPEPAAEKGRIIINGGALVRAGFFVAPSLKAASGYRLLKVKSFQRNLDVTVEYSMDGDPLTVGFSLVRLPEQPMKPRPADDRLLYFTTDYRDLGEHGRYRDELPEESVDRKVSTIWRYNLPALPGNEIRIHIDPTVPKRWRRWFRRGVEAWNEAFSLLGKPKAVRAVLPEDADWPKDYDVSDARFSTISWTITKDVVSMGIAKVDPRSGEIMKSDIIMSDGWVQAWLGDLDLLAPNFTHQLQETKGFRLEARADGNVVLGRRRVPGRLHLKDGLKEANWGKKISLLALAKGEPMAPKKRDEVLGQGLQDVVTHETGHILGLRHNFKGSLGVTYACIRSSSCSAVHGLTASVMDYVPVNLPTADEPDVHLFTPVLGGYDKLAIQYGYMEVNGSDANASAAARPKLDAELRDVLREAERYETCYDADRVAGQDPSCAAYDISADPLQAYEDELKRLAAVQLNLLNTSVMPGAPYRHYGEAVDQVLLLARSVGVKLVSWLGGVMNSYVNRRLDGSHPHKVARKPLPQHVQRRALGLLLQILRPGNAGLLPPAEGLPYLVAATQGDGSLEALDLDLRVRSIARTLISNALAPEQLLRLHAQERLEDGLDSSAFLSVGEFLARFVSGVVGAGLATPSPLEWELHRLLVKGLAQIHQSSTLPGVVRAQAAHHLRKLRQEADTALGKIELSSLQEDEPAAAPREQELLQAHLAGLHQQLTSSICGDGPAHECPGLGGGAAPAARLGWGVWVLALLLGPLLAPAA